MAEVLRSGTGEGALRAHRGPGGTSPGSAASRPAVRWEQSASRKDHAACERDLGEESLSGFAHHEWGAPCG